MQTFINRALNLLLGPSTGENFVLGPLYVYTPTIKFITPLPEYISTIRSTLFGSAPDTTMLSYRALQFMLLLHQPITEKYILNLDSRISYLSLFSKIDFRNNIFENSITRLFGSGQLQIIKQPTADEKLGRLFHSWKLQVYPSQKLLVLRTVQPEYYNYINFTISGNYSDPITLPGSDAQIIITDSPATSWFITCITRPTRTLVDIYNDVSNILSVERKNNLFGSPPNSLFSNFYDLWYKSDNVLHKLSGVLLALIYRMNDLTLDK